MSERYLPPTSSELLRVSAPAERPIASRSDPDPYSATARMTFYDLLRHFVRDSHWRSNEEEYAAECLINDLEELAVFGTVADHVKSEEA